MCHLLFLTSCQPYAEVLTLAGSADVHCAHQEAAKSDVWQPAWLTGGRLPVPQVCQEFCQQAFADVGMLQQLQGGVLAVVASDWVLIACSQLR